MKLYAPKYYRNFKCIADKCSHSCCIGWEIDVDSGALEKYKGLKDGYGEVISRSISMDGAPHFVLLENDRCPHLDGKGLCRIISSLGDGYLCDICREHPRFYNYTSVAEVGIGMSCEEAARVILSSGDYNVIEQIGETDGEAYECEFDARYLRGEIYETLKEDGASYGKRLDRIYREYDLTARDDGFWLDILDTLEYLDPKHKELFMKYSSDVRAAGSDVYLERFLAYFIYRHCTEAADTEDFCRRLEFCLFCERLFSSLISVTDAEGSEEITDLARIISEEIEYSEENTEALTYFK